MSTTGTVSASSALGVVEFVDLNHRRKFHPLHQQLGDAVAARDHNGRFEIVIDEADFDFAAVASVDSARRIDDRQAGTRGQTGPRMDQSHRSHRQGDRNPGADQLATARLQDQIGRGKQVYSSVTGVCASREREFRIEATDPQWRIRIGRHLRGHPRRLLGRSPIRLEAVSKPASSPAPQQDRYAERLSVPWWWWLAAVVVTGILGYEIQLAAYRAAWSFVAYPVIAILIAWMLYSMGRTQVRVTADGSLHAGKAILPTDVIARGASIAASQRSAAMGRQLDPAAYVIHRAWVKTMVLVVLDDPDDPTPYWLISTRQPGAVLAALGMGDAGSDAGKQDAAQG